MQLDPIKPAGRLADVPSLKKRGPDLSVMLIFSVRMAVLKVDASNKAYGALHFFNGHKQEITLWIMTLVGSEG